MYSPPKTTLTTLKLHLNMQRDTKPPHYYRFTLEYTDGPKWSHFDGMGIAHGWNLVPKLIHHVTRRIIRDNYSTVTIESIDVGEDTVTVTFHTTGTIRYDDSTDNE